MVLNPSYSLYFGTSFVCDIQIQKQETALTKLKRFS